METWLLNHPGKQERKKRSNQIKTMEEIEAETFLPRFARSAIVNKLLQKK